MAKLTTQPIVFCRVCGAALIVNVTTFVSDPEGLLLQEFLKTAAQFALCDFHRQQREYYISQNRQREWEEVKMYLHETVVEEV